MRIVLKKAIFAAHILRKNLFRMNNKMKCGATLLLLVFAVSTLVAQNYRVEIGNVQARQSGKNSSVNIFNGVRLGATAEFDLKYNFSFLTGALYSVVYDSKVQRFGVSTDSVTYKTWGHYIDVPLRIQYNLKLKKDFKLFAFAGPNINFGLAQPQKIIPALSDEMEKFTGIEKKEYYENDLYKMAKISRLNFQLGAGAGIQWKNYQLKGGYDFGINSINKVDSNRILRHSGWYVSLVYEF